MITEKDLQEAIAECEGQRKPGANTCLKLAAFYTIKNQLYPDNKETAYMPEPVYQSAYPVMPQGGYMAAGDIKKDVVDYDSGSDFSEAIKGKNAADMWGIMDELMDAVFATNPRLYESVMRKIKY